MSNKTKTTPETIYGKEPMWCIVLGNFVIRPSRSSPEKIWIEKDDGEGGEFDASLFRRAVEKFYDENF